MESSSCSETESSSCSETESSPSSEMGSLLSFETKSSPSSEMESSLSFETKSSPSFEMESSSSSETGEVLEEETKEEDLTLKNYVENPLLRRIPVFDAKCIKAPVGTKLRKHSSLKGFKIENNYKKMINEKFTYWKGILPQEIRLLEAAKNILETGVNKQNYIKYFTYTLWMEEQAAIQGLEMYTMTNVKIKHLRGNIIEVGVPGLGEKRPSVLPGDIISVRMVGDNTAYQGVVDSLGDKSMFIKYFDEDIFQLFKIYPKELYDIKFEFSRLQLVRMHEGVAGVAKKLLISLFPERPATRAAKNTTITELFNTGLNEEQLTAVNNIVNCSSKHAPYIVFGPPGTGKTVTIVEAILQTVKLNPKANVLVCAPSNTACDNLASKLYEYFDETNGVLRIHALSRDPNLIPKDVKKCSNLVGDCFSDLKSKDLCKYRIIIATLHLVGKFNKDYRPKFLFIDEAAQATEPECDIAISMMLPGNLIVLAGDPEQLGPVVLSYTAEKYGLGRSLMERLMYKNSLYEDNYGRYDDNFITMLVKNYRSHPDILKLPNKLFYQDKLIAKDPGNDSISDISISARVLKEKKTTKGKSVEFCGLLSIEERNGTSPSYFNQQEIQMVVKYVRALMGLKKSHHVEEDDIGIITPYIRQVSKIKQALNGMNLGNIDVGTTEVFQGREKRIILISTVRAQDLLLEHDKKFQLGFVRNKRRFNVAVTRAKSKLIIIGNPHILSTDGNWKSYIDLCKSLGSHSGIDYDTSSGLRGISNRLSNLNLNSSKQNRRPTRKRGRKEQERN